MMFTQLLFLLLKSLSLLFLCSYLSWDEYFMSVAFLSAMRSKDPRRQVGAVIVSPNNVILGIGYNGFPFMSSSETNCMRAPTLNCNNDSNSNTRGNNDTVLSWSKKSKSGSWLDTKHPYVCHAEMNAILNKNTASVQGGVSHKHYKTHNSNKNNNDFSFSDGENDSSSMIKSSLSLSMTIMDILV